MTTSVQTSSGEWMVLILASPSGGGKTTLKNMLLEPKTRQGGIDFRFSISHTTRKKRPHEEEGREYHFVDRSTFERMISEKQFAEFAEVHGNLYGTSLEAIDGDNPQHHVSGERAYKGVVLDLDYQGARQLKAKVHDAVLVFILPPSLAKLEERLRSRQDEPEESIRRRLENARGEVAQYAMFDYVIMNDQLDRAFDVLRSIVLAERHRRSRAARDVERLLREWDDPELVPPMSLRRP